MIVTDKPNRDRQVDTKPTEATIGGEKIAVRPAADRTAAHLGQNVEGAPRRRRRVRHSASRLVRGICTLLIFAVPLAAFVHEMFKRKAPSPTAAVTAAPASWHPTPPPIMFADVGNVGWALSAHKPSALEKEELVLTGVVPIIPKRTPPTQLPASLNSMPTTGWTLDNGAKITTDSRGVLVLRPLTKGRPSLPGQGAGWRGAYWLPLNTSHWENYTLRVTITNLGSDRQACRIRGLDLRGEDHHPEPEWRSHLQWRHPRRGISSRGRHPRQATPRRARRVADRDISCWQGPGRHWLRGLQADRDQQSTVLH